MAPSALPEAALPSSLQSTKTSRPTAAPRITSLAPASAVLHRSLHVMPPQVAHASGSWVTFTNGQRMLDTTCGAAVACIGYSDERVKKAMREQMEKFSYTNAIFFGTGVGEELAKELVRGTGGKMARALMVCSGSEAMDAAMKMSRQYFMEIKPPQPQRVSYIARHGSYHGTTIGSLSIGGHTGRRELFEPMLLPNCGKVSPCYEYRGRKKGQSIEQYVDMLAQELDDKFQEMGPETVIAFVAEPVVGAAMGCVPSVPGYFRAVKAICDKYGALLILDEVMSGMGRCGTLHVWEQEGIIPDVQTIAKGLGGGYAPAAAVLINHRVADALFNGSGAFSHGQTYQGHPLTCAAALEVQRIIASDKLVSNVSEMGSYLGQLLHQNLDSHPHVGDIRGKGLFWGIEFVAAKSTKTPFPRSEGIANKIHTIGLQPAGKDFGISLYPGVGTVDGVLGDHVILAPAYTVTGAEVELIVEMTTAVVEEAFGDCLGCKEGTCR